MTDPWISALDGLLVMRTSETRRVVVAERAARGGDHNVAGRSGKAEWQSCCREASRSMFPPGDARTSSHGGKTYFLLGVENYAGYSTPTNVPVDRSAAFSAANRFLVGCRS